MSLTKQKGLTKIGNIFVLGVFAFIVLTGFKIVPMYMDFYQAESILKSVKDDTSIDKSSNNEIWTAIRKRLSVNNIRYLEKKDFEIYRENGQTKITMEYEVKKEYFANIFIGGNFSSTVELGN